MIWKTALTIAEFLLGFAFLYVRFLLNESEERKLQSALTSLWVRIEERSQAVRARTTRLMRGATFCTLRIYDRIFGSRLISGRAIVISLTFGVASTWLVHGCNLYMNPYDFVIQDGTNAQGEATIFGARCEDVIEGRLLWCLLKGILGIVGGSLPILFPKSRAVLAYALASAIVISAVSWVAALSFSYRPADSWWWMETSIEEYRERERIAASVVMVFQFSIAPLAVLLCVAGARHILRRSMQAFSWKTASVSVSASLVLAVACIYFAAQLDQDLLFEDPLTLKWFVWHIVSVAMDTQLLATMISLTYSAIICAALACLLLWPFLSRVTYAVERTHLFQQSRVLTTVGMALVIHASSGTAWLIDALKSLGY